MLSVAEILQHELLHTAEVVAGHEGLSREVRWVHNAGVPDAANWLNGGELVMTTIFNMPDNEAEQCEYIQQLAAKNVAGLVITIGRYIDAIPHYLRQVADDVAFPLIEIPFTARFVDIAQAINEGISQSSLAVQRRALTIHQTLTNLVLEGGGLGHLAERLAQLLNHSVSIETDHFDAIATHNIAEVDEARRYTQLHGRTDPRLVKALEKEGILPEIRQHLRPKHLEVMADVGLEMERILAPIVVHGEIYGFMWIIADEHKLTEIDMMAIEIGSTIAALMMLYQESIQSAEASLKGSLMSQLIEGNANRETILTDTSMRYGVDLRSPYVMIVLECAMNGSQKLGLLYRTVNQIIATDGWQAVVGQFAGQVLILAQVDEQLRHFTEKVQVRVHLSNVCVEGIPRVGVSGIQQGAEQVRQAYDQCRDVLYISQRLHPARKVIYFSELGYLHTLYHAGATTLSGNQYVPLLRRLLDETQADLFRTLEAYLDSGSNGVATADSLHIHRSTLNYRLQRINHIIDFNLQDPIIRTNLQVAIKLLRLFEVQESHLG
ncbi:MAG: PucR family transcriptional regulator ligand-binding domain-containing protein [Phototrophicaceae bacterium]